MSKNILQIFTTNPASSMQNTDLLYLGRSPFGVNSDFGITWANMVASIIAQGAGGSNTQVQYNNNGALAGDTGFTTNGNGTLVASTSLSVANVNIAGNTISSTDSGGSLYLNPNPLGSLVTNSNATIAQFTSYVGGSALFYMVGSDSATAQPIINLIALDSSTPEIQTFSTTASAIGSFSPLANNDPVFSFNFHGDDGTGLLLCGQITSLVSGSVSHNIVPTAMFFRTMDTSGNINSGITINADGSTTLFSPLKVGSGGLGISTTPTNGQIPIGNGTNYVANTLTAGTGISITNASGGVTLNASGGGLTWTTLAGTTQAASVNNGYVSGAAGATTVTLPATAAVGAVIAVEGLGAGGWVLTANTGQTIKIGSSTTTSAGSLTSVAASDNVYVTCIVANTTWRVRSTNSAGLTIS